MVKGAIIALEKIARPLYTVGGMRTSASQNQVGTLPQPPVDGMDSNCRLSLIRLCLSVDRGEGMEISKGCATRQVCDILNNPHLRSAIGGEIKCCQGDFCNSASSTSASLLLLAAPLVSLVMFS